MSWCLPKYLSQPFLEKLQSGDIDLDKIRDMKPSDRHKYFTDMFGEEHGTRANALLEKTILLKDFQRGATTWIKDVAGLKPEVKRDMVSRVNKMENILNPAEEEAFMQDLVDYKLGIHIPYEAAQKLTELASAINENQMKIKDVPVFPPDKAQLDYAEAKWEFRNYYNELVNAAQKKTLAEYVKHPIQTLDIGLHKSLGLMKSMLSTLDDSVVGTQGIKTALNDTANAVLLKPTHQWFDNAKKTFSDMFLTWGGRNMEKAVFVDIMSRPNSINGLYDKHKVAVNTMEENYPEHLGGVPVLGRALKGFENAFTGFQLRNRADTFDALVNIAKAAGKDPFSTDIEGFGKLANTLTARGSLELGRYNFEPIADFVNLVAFAGRFAKSNVDFLTFNQLHMNMSPYARKVGAIQSLKGIAVIAAFLALVEVLWPGSVEWDDTKTTFGGIKIGTIIYQPFKMFTSYIVLAMRLFKARYTSLAGKVTKLNTGEYGKPTKMNVLLDFLSGKESPPLRILDDILKGQTFDKEKPGIMNETLGVVTPIPAQTAQEYYKNSYIEDADKILALLAESLGVRTTPVKYPEQKPKKSSGVAIPAKH